MGETPAELPFIGDQVVRLSHNQAARSGPRKEAATKLLWTIERKLAEDNARPIIYYRPGGTCLQPYVKGVTIDVNYIFGSWRMEDVWLDK